MLSRFNHSFLRYTAVGGIGFLVDGGLLYLLTAMGMGEFVARIVSIILALFVTWWIHRRFTFHVEAPPSLAEVARYYASNAMGAAVNYGVYCALILYVTDKIWMALITASVVALAVNYAGARVVVFGYHGR